MKRMTIRLPSEYHQRLVQMAAKFGHATAEFAREKLIEVIEKEEHKLSTLPQWKKWYVKLSPLARFET
jgi:predicted DNA-binding protein